MEQWKLPQKFSTSNIYVPDGYTLGQNLVPFDSELAWKSIEVSGKPEALQPYNFGGKTYHLYKTIDPMELNKITPEVFTYEYRDTDPVEEELGNFLQKLITMTSPTQTQSHHASVMVILWDYCVRNAA